MRRDRLGNWLLGVGALTLIAGSLAIETSIVLLFLPVRAGFITGTIALGIGLALAGGVLLFTGKRLKQRG